MSVLGGKWINEKGAHRCPVPGVFGFVVNKVGSVWECNCGRRHEVTMVHGTKEWMPQPGNVLTRRDVLDRLANVLALDLAGTELANWRTQVNQVLAALEDQGMAPWLDGPVSADR